MIVWNIRTERDLAVAEFFSLPAIRAHLKGDGTRLRKAAEARDADEMERRTDEREEMDRDTDEANERANELHDELRAEEQFRMDSEIRQAEADYLNPRN